MTERKLSILRTLLARVQERSHKARTVPLAADGVQKSAAPASTSANVEKGEAPEHEPVPPSAPRVREAAVESLDQQMRAATRQTLAPEAEEEAGQAEEELQEEDMEITISDHPPPPPEPVEPVEIPRAASVTRFSEPPAEERESALVLENETPAPAAVAEAHSALRDDLSWPPAAPPTAEPQPPAPMPPAPPPAPVAPPQAYVAADEDTMPAVFPPRVPAPSPAAPEVTVADARPEVHRAPALRGPVGTFVEQSRTFSPRSFGELLQASLDLGRDA